MALRSQTQRYLLRAFILCVVLCGAVGMGALLLGVWSSLIERVLATTAAVGGASILGLAAAVPTERRRWHPLGPLALAAVLAALGLALVLIWIDWRWYESEWFLKVCVTAFTFAVALPHLGLLALARLKRRHEWIRLVTVAAIGLLVAHILGIIWMEWEPDSRAWRVLGMNAIAIIVGTVVTPILHRVALLERRESVRTTALRLALTCPRCAAAQELPVGRSACASCGLKFSIEIEDVNCERCGYPLYGLTTDRCPECGDAFARPMNPPVPGAPATAPAGQSSNADGSTDDRIHARADGFR